MHRRKLRILIIRLSSIGDVVRTLPVLHGLRAACPSAQVDWVVERKSAAILEGHPCLDNLIVFERSKGFFQAAKQFLSICGRIRKARYDLVLDLHGILKSGVLAGFSRAPDRVGFARPRSREGSSLFLNKRVRVSSDSLTRVEENLELCRAVVNRFVAPPITIYVPSETQDSVNHFFDETFDSGKYVVAVHAPVGRPEKQWPLEHYCAVCDMLLADGRFEVMLTWGPGQLEGARKVLERARRHPVLAPETPDLKHYAWLVHRADIYLGGDTGPMHIASAMGTPVVAIFGGTDPLKHAPYRPPYELLSLNSDPGFARMRPEERLQRITPAMAYDACVRLITAVQEPPARPR